MNLLNQCQGVKCKQQRRDGGDNVVGTFIRKVRHQGNTKHRCYKHRVHLSSSLCCPALRCSQSKILSFSFSSSSTCFSNKKRSRLRRQKRPIYLEELPAAASLHRHIHLTTIWISFETLWRSPGIQDAKNLVVLLACNTPSLCRSTHENNS